MEPSHDGRLMFVLSNNCLSVIHTGEAHVGGIVQNWRF